MALALYRRYRPDTFEGVIGQDQVTVPLMRALDAGRLTHAYLFSGPRGCGKTSCARILARCVNCAQGPTSHPCGECASCRDLATGGPGSIDVVEIDAASHNGVDDARELRERAGFAPARDRYKIFILDEAHMVTQQGFNALLKIVEEPPEHVMFIFATTEPDKVIGTIRSRTHHYPFRLVPPEVMGPYLEDVCRKEHITAEPGVLKLAMRAGGGSMRDTLSVLDQLMVGAVDGVITHDASIALLGFTPEALIGQAVDAVIDADGEALYGVIQKVVVGGFDPRRFVEDLLARVRDLLVLTLAGEQAESVMSDSAEAENMDDLHRQAKALGLGPLTAMADMINTALGSMAGATSPRMRLELLAARLLAGRENGWAAVPAAGTPAPVTAAVPATAPAAATSARSAAASSASSGAAQPAAHTGGFVGASRHHQKPQPSAQPVVRPAVQPAAQSAAQPVTQPAAQPAVQPVAQPAAAETTETFGQAAPAAPATDDGRTPDERWDALVAGLPEDVRAYVNRSRVPRIKLDDPSRPRRRLWVKFDTPLNKYAFALAVAGEAVDGTTSVVSILRAAVHKAFGQQVALAPTERMANGEVAPAWSKLPPEEQRRIKGQLLKAKIKANPGAAAAAAPHTDGSSSGGMQSSSAQSSSDDVSSSASSGSSGNDDDDPWAAPAPARASDAGMTAGAPASSTAKDASAPAPEHHHKHAAVPDMSDPTDPWALPMPVASAPAQTAAGSATSASLPTHPAGPAAVPSQQNDDPWKDVPPPGEPADNPAFSAPTHQATRPHPAAPSQSGTPTPFGTSAQSGMPGQSDGWSLPGPTRPVQQPGQSVPSAQSAQPGQSVPSARSGQSAPAQPDSPRSGSTTATPADSSPAASEDEYSMDDQSLGDAEAVELDSLRRMFDVKQVEEFAADDPHNPANQAARHTEE